MRRPSQRHSAFDWLGGWTFVRNHATFGNMDPFGKAPLLRKALAPRERAGSSCRCYTEMIHEAASNGQAEQFFDGRVAG